MSCYDDDFDDTMSCYDDDFDDIHFIYLEYGSFLNDLNREKLKISGDCVCQWSFFLLYSISRIGQANLCGIIV